MKYQTKFEISRYPAGFGIALNFYNVKDEWDLTRREREMFGMEDLPFPPARPKARLGKQSHLKAVPDGAGQEEDEDDQEEG
ncbi:MAG: hypothetical protein IPI39_00485 [Candidatus Obscuribacter sp.]|nr:hypothetical protein [Candidatus Obscuribacter sp.]MBK9618876.1 hypothetical protein [Candidatus Obscuribacter sp.]